VHARCAEIDVSVEYGERLLRLKIADDGLGINPESCNGPNLLGHFGLLGMRERALQLNARLSIEANGQTGTKVSVAVPARLAFVDNMPTVRARFAMMLTGWQGNRDLGCISPPLDLDGP
jgi:signal transduction histidine kinase